MLILSLLISALIASSCYTQAQKRGRNPLYWFIGGLFFGIFALIVLLLLPVQQKRMNRVEIPSPMPMLQPKEAAHSQLFWYYLGGDKTQHGPMSFDALRRAWREGNVHDHTLVWNESMNEWKSLQEVAQPFTS